jgi:hypothetical protein
MTTTTLTLRNRSRKPVCGRALADHQFVGCLERTAATETWESHSPDGRRWLVKVLFNVTGPDPKRADAVRRLQELRHPNLAPAVVLPGGPGCLAIVSPYPAPTLFDLLQQHQADGEIGLPRAAVLDWLRTAAVALDEVATQHGVSHLALTPRHLSLSLDKLLIADHGLAHLLWLPTAQFHGQVQARYAAPELPDRLQDGRACDQFSLAAVFQELLTGTPPFRSRPAGEPNLAPLPDADRAAVARALSFDPAKRFPTCVDFVDALENGGADDAVGPLSVDATPPAPANEAALPEPAMSGSNIHETPAERIAAVQTLLFPSPRPKTHYEFVLDAVDPPSGMAGEPPASGMADLQAPPPPDEAARLRPLGELGDSSVVNLDAAAFIREPASSVGSVSREDAASATMPPAPAAPVEVSEPIAPRSEVPVEPVPESESTPEVAAAAPPVEPTRLLTDSQQPSPAVAPWPKEEDSGDTGAKDAKPS